MSVLTDRERREVGLLWRLIGALFIIVGALAVLSVLSWMARFWFSWLTMVVGGLVMLVGLAVLVWATLVDWWRGRRTR